MPRALRIQDAGFVHHVITRGNDRQIIFQDNDDFLYYLNLLHQSRQLFPLKIYNFCLMDNHVHLLVEPATEGSLSKCMEMVSKGYAKYFNKKHGRVGHVWQGRFKSFLIQKERYFFACSRYIDLNPVKANIIQDPKDYPWSGFGYLAYGNKSAIELDQHELYQGLGSNEFERMVSYRALVTAHQGDELDLLNRRAGILGDADFKEKLVS